MSAHKGWIGVDLDGCLAFYDKWRGSKHIGAPVPAMVDRVKAWLKSGVEVRVFTARVSKEALELNKDTLEEIGTLISNWCLEHIGAVLPVTNEKDMSMVELWDDRAIGVIPNEGQRMDHGGWAMADQLNAECLKVMQALNVKTWAEVMPRIKEIAARK